MIRFLVRRLASAVITLFCVSIILFAVAQVLPGDVGRTILGPYATEQQVRALDHQLGVDRPLAVRYATWLAGFVRGEWGKSYLLNRPVLTIAFNRLGNSLILGGFALCLIVPVSVGLGVVAALNYGGWPDRVISVTGLSLSAMPEFVTGIVLIVVLGVELKWLPVTASAGSGAGDVSQFRHLILPAIPLVLILFGYIARMARAGTIESLNSDYARTAILKGLPRTTVIRRHVLRNSLLPTITVIATQTGYLIGGLVVVERLFNYQGIGNLIFKAADAKDFPMLMAGVLLIGVVYAVATLAADVLLTVLNPRLRIGVTGD